MEPKDQNGQPEPEQDAGRARQRQRRIELIPSRPGRLVSVAGLVERVVEQFVIEHGQESTALREADTVAKRMALVRDSAQYIFAVESVQMSQEDQAHVIRQAYSAIFGYGPLDPLLLDERITTILLEGIDKISVRYGPGEELTLLDPVFEDHLQLQRIIGRLLEDAGAELRDDEPIIEAGFLLNNRPVNINIVAPPFSPALTADIRLHPANLPALDDLVAGDFMSQGAADFLRALARSEHGFVIVGDTESGKTTLLAVLAQLLPRPEHVISVERSGELRLPEGAERLVVRWPVGETPGYNLAACVEQALEKAPGCLLLDEVRADEPEAIRPLLQHENPPRLIWTFRGGADPKRIRSALGMVARRADPAQPEVMVSALYERLPFVVIVRRRRGSLRLHGIAEWQPAGEYVDFIELFEMDMDHLRPTGRYPRRSLDLDT